MRSKNGWLVLQFNDYFPSSGVIVSKSLVFQIWMPWLWKYLYHLIRKAHGNELLKESTNWLLKNVD